MSQWNDVTRATGLNYGLPDEAVTEDELAAAIADINACTPLTETQMDTLFPLPITEAQRKRNILLGK